jgi:hypothetical protein
MEQLPGGGQDKFSMEISGPRAQLTGNSLKRGIAILQINFHASTGGASGFEA